MTANAAVAAEKYRDEILQTLDEVYGVVFDGPDISDEEVELLKLLAADDLELIASLADEYAENVRAYALLSQEALQAKDSKAGEMPLPGGDHRPP